MTKCLQKCEFCEAQEHNYCSNKACKCQDYSSEVLHDIFGVWIKNEV